MSNLVLSNRTKDLMGRIARDPDELQRHRAELIAIPSAAVPGDVEIVTRGEIVGRSLKALQSMFRARMERLAKDHESAVAAESAAAAAAAPKAK